MKKTLVAISVSLLVALPVMADNSDYTVSDKPPEFKPSAETVERSQRDQAIQAEEKIQAEKEKAELVFPEGHDPRDHDHDHDDAEDLDHTHDDPRAHEKQLEILSEQGEVQESKWWKFW